MLIVRLLAAVILVSISIPSGTASAAADLAAGKKVFRKCAACHAVGKDDGHRIGPNLHGLFGRKAGSAEGFRYSKAMTNSNVIWSEETLERYLAGPKSFIPGNRMPFPGLPKATDRRDVISFLKSAAQ